MKNYLQNRYPEWVLACLSVVLLLVIWGIPELLPPSEVSGVVTEKYISRNGRYGDIFHVVVQTTTNEKIILQNKDALFWGKFNSADVQQEIEIGKKYQFTVVGWRIPFLSWFQNIVIKES